MKITTTAFDSVYHNSEKKSGMLGEYILHSVDVWNFIEIDGKQYQVTYQTGMQYLNGQYSSPDPKLDISNIEGAGTHALISLIDDMEEADFDDYNSELEYLGYANNLCDSIKTVDDLHALYRALRDNHPGCTEQFIPDEYQSSDLDDYRVDESTGYLIPLD